MVLLAHCLAEGINPLFVLLLLIAPFLGPRAAFPRIVTFWGLTVLGIALAVVLAEEGKRHVVWAGHPGFPSGHETFALACATSLVCWRGTWIWLVLPLAVVLGWALVAAHYHETADVWGALLTGPAPALLCQAARLRWKKPSS